MNDALIPLLKPWAFPLIVVKRQTVSNNTYLELENVSKAYRDNSAEIYQIHSQYLTLGRDNRQIHLTKAGHFFVTLSIRVNETNLVYAQLKFVIYNSYDFEGYVFPDDLKEKYLSDNALLQDMICCKYFNQTIKILVNSDRSFEILCGELIIIELPY